MDTQLENPIVVGVDGSVSSDLAVEWAADAAQLRERQLKIVYVMEAPGPRIAYEHVSAELSAAARELTSRAESIARARHPALRIDSAAVHDDTAHALIRESDHASMVVVGNRGHGGFYDLVLGSTSLQTAMYAHCPVAVIRPRAEATEPSSRGRIIVGVDGSPRSAASLELAFAEADLRDVGLTAVHAWLGVMGEESAGMAYMHETDVLEANASTLLQEAIAGWRARYPQVDVREIAVQGSAAGALINQSMGAEVVVVGCRGHGGFAGLLLGSVSQAVIHHAGCPVLVAHAPTASS
jgi:nucleotide-binding universal stress UspA family protein